MSWLTDRLESLTTLLFKRPDVIVDIVFDNGQLHVVLANQGKSCAQRIRVKFHQPFHGVDGRKLVSEQAVFHATEYLPAGKQIRTFLDTTQAYFSRKEPTLISLTVGFEDRFGRHFQREITHNLEIYRDIGYVKVS